MIYLLRKHDLISVHFIREAYIIRISGFHLASDIIRDQRERISLKKDRCSASVFFPGGLEEIRTPDPHNANVVRSQLRYKPVYLSIILPEKWLVKGKGGIQW